MKLYFLLLSCASLVWTKNGARIIGGTTAHYAQFPFAVAIYKTTPNGQFFCTGTLLTNQWVITAGQCVDGATLFTILLGTNHLNSGGEKLATSSYVLHPEYDPVTLVHDVGLIRFRAPIEFTNYIHGVSLPFEAEPSKSRATAYGWGQISDDESNLSNDLMWVLLTSVSDEECRITYGGQLKENMVCYEGSFNEGTCYGDAGSPLIQRPTKDYVVVGVATFFSANGCESTDPSGYTKVFPYNEWIRNVTGQED